MSINASNQNNPYEDAADPYDYDYTPFSQNKSDLKQPLSTTQQVGITSSALDEESMRLRAMELAKREAELEKREKELLARGGAPAQEVKKANWPRCYPLVYHSISTIPGKLRRTVAIMGYVGLYIFTVMMFLNFIGAMITISPLISIGKDDLSPLSRVKMAIMSFLFMVIGPAAHFGISYWPLYKAMQTGHIARFAICFVTYAIPILFCAFCFTGWYDYGPCGLILMIMSVPLQNSGNLTMFIVNTIMTVLWLLLAVYFLVIYILTLHVFRKENHTFKKARDVLRQQLVSGVSQAVVTGVTTAASNTATTTTTASV